MSSETGKLTLTNAISRPKRVSLVTDVAPFRARLIKERPGLLQNQLQLNQLAVAACEALRVGVDFQELSLQLFKLGLQLVNVNNFRGGVWARQNLRLVNLNAQKGRCKIFRNSAVQFLSM